MATTTPRFAKTLSTTTGEARYVTRRDLNGHAGISWQFRQDANVYQLRDRRRSERRRIRRRTSSGYGGRTFNGVAAGAEPEQSEIELAPRNIFDERLLLTAALFQITKTDVMEGAGIYTSRGPSTPARTKCRDSNSARAELTDVEAQAGFTPMMESEVLESFAAERGQRASNSCRRHGLPRSCATRSRSSLAGDEYESRKYAGHPTRRQLRSADRALRQPVPSYTVFDLFATWEFSGSSMRG